LCGLLDFLRGKGGLGLGTNVETTSFSESISGLVCDNGEMGGKLEILSTETMSAELVECKEESEREQSGTECGKTKESKEESLEGSVENCDEGEMEAKRKIDS